jgi:hypothetical protein
MSCQCEGVYTSDPLGYAWVFASPRDIRREEWIQKPLIFLCFHEIFLGNQYEIWSKQHNGKVRYFMGRGNP